jgi:hypothetical protein
LFQNHIASIRRERREHDYAACRHSVIRAGVTANSPVQVARVYFRRCLSFKKGFIHHAVQFRLEIFTGRHVGDFRVSCLNGPDKSASRESHQEIARENRSQATG